jgi:hypothetical protein
MQREYENPLNMQRQRRTSGIYPSPKMRKRLLRRGHFGGGWEGVFCGESMITRLHDGRWIEERPTRIRGVKIGRVKSPMIRKKIDMDE